MSCWRNSRPQTTPSSLPRLPVPIRRKRSTSAMPCSSRFRGSWESRPSPAITTTWCCIPRTG
ncbi:hypothetical protein AJ87_06465 [Rhizobium yanglingense]|nr:hypothetical protein AJ87_06465 [Rhizobium yanglingense]